MCVLNEESIIRQEVMGDNFECDKGIYFKLLARKSLSCDFPLGMQDLISFSSLRSDGLGELFVMFWMVSPWLSTLSSCPLQFAWCYDEPLLGRDRHTLKLIKDVLFSRLLPHHNPGGSGSACDAEDLGWEDPLDVGMATYCRILAWRIPMDRGAWWATVHRVAKSWTWLSN